MANSTLPARQETIEVPQAASAIASLPREMAILKMQNDNIMSLAAAAPRNYKKILEDLEDQIDAYPLFAKDVIYCKPVGKDKTGKMQFARGLSIRAAEALAEAYGYNLVSSDISPIPGDEDRVKISAAFVDYQRGRIWQDSGIISKWFRTYRGTMEKHPEDRFHSLVCKAESSRRVREVITRSVPPSIRKAMWDMAERKIDALLDESTVQKIIANFASKGVDLPKLEDHLGRTLKSGWTKEDRLHLLGMWNELKDGEISPEQLMEKHQSASGGAPVGGITGADLGTAKATTESETTPAPKNEATP